MLVGAEDVEVDPTTEGVVDRVWDAERRADEADKLLPLRIVFPWSQVPATLDRGLEDMVVST